MEKTEIIQLGNTKVLGRVGKRELEMVKERNWLGHYD